MDSSTDLFPLQPRAENQSSPPTYTELVPLVQGSEAPIFQLDLEIPVTPTETPNRDGKYEVSNDLERVICKPTVTPRRSRKISTVAKTTRSASPKSKETSGVKLPFNTNKKKSTNERNLRQTSLTKPSLSKANSSARSTTSRKDDGKVVKDVKTKLAKPKRRRGNNMSPNLEKAKQSRAKKTYTCEQCKASFTASGSLKAHMNAHKGIKPYRCDTCQATFSQGHSLKSHKLIHTGVKPYKCDMCDYATNQASALKTHKRIHTGEKPYECKLCNYAATCLGALHAHMTSHTDEKRFACAQCEKSFKHRTTLYVHVNQQHKAVKLVSCEHCERKFICQQYLVMHTRFMHSISKDYKCDHCGRNFPTARQRTIHVRSHTVSYPCSLCSVTLSSKHNVRQHISAVHNKIKEHLCEDCGKLFSSKGYLNKHRMRHAGIKPFKCETCDQQFNKRQQLWIHQSVDHSAKTDRPEALFACTKCSHKYVHQTSLKRHMLCHSSEPTHKCKKCPATYYSYSGLREHHLWEHRRSYVCENCTMRFGKAYALAAHKKTHKNMHKCSGESCNQVFFSQYALSLHKAKTHPELMFKCGLCPFHFTTKRLLKLHVQRRHSKNHCCDACSMTFQSKSGLLKHHTSIHQSDGVSKPSIKKCARIECLQCGEKFSEPSAMKRHQVVHTLKQPFKCPVCFITFKNVWTAKMHMVSKHEEAQLYKCHQCTKAFAQRKSRREHIARVHLKIRPFACDQCEASFDRYHEIVEHVLIHTGEKPWKCEECGERFRLRREHHYHKRRQHERKLTNLICKVKLVRVDVEDMLSSVKCSAEQNTSH